MEIQENGVFQKTPKGILTIENGKFFLGKEETQFSMNGNILLKEGQIEDKHISPAEAVKLVALILNQDTNF